MPPVLGVIGPGRVPSGSAVFRLVAPAWALVASGPETRINRARKTDGAALTLLARSSHDGAALERSLKRGSRTMWLKRAAQQEQDSRIARLSRAGAEQRPRPDD